MNFNMFPAIRDVIHNDGVPSKCVIYDERMKVRNTCTFPPIEHHTVQYHQDDVFVFDCCVKNGQIPLSWWDNADTSLSPISDTKQYVITEGKFVAFLCGENVTHSLMKIHRILTLHLQEGHYNISVSATIPEVQTQENDTKNDARCITITVNASVVVFISLTSTTTQASSTFLKSQDKDSSSNCVVSEVKSTIDIDVDEETKQPLIYLWVTSAIALLFSIVICFGICFSKCYKRFLIKYQYRVKRERSHGISMNMIQSVDGQSADAATLSSHTSANGIDPEHGGITVHRSPLRRQRIYNPEQKDSLPELPLRRGCVYKDEVHIANHPGQRGGEDGVKETREKDKGSGTGEGNTSADISGAVAQSLDSTYCSVRDVNDTNDIPANLNIVPEAVKAATWIAQTSGYQGTSLDGGTRVENTPFQCVKTKIKNNNSSIDNVTWPTSDVEALYAKPDISRKTKKLVGVPNQPLESVPELEKGLSDRARVTCLGVGHVEKELCSDILLPTGSLDDPPLHNSDHIYGNSAANTIDSSKDYDDLYMNTSVHSFY